MKFPWLVHPGKGIPDVMTTLLVIATVAASVRFILDGVTLVVYGHTITFGHSDAMAYASILSPVFGAHGYITGKSSSDDTTGRPDNVDAQ